MFNKASTQSPLAHDIRVTAEGVTLADSASGWVIWEIAWQNVRQICCWKEDLWSVDLICMGFRVGPEPKFLWCDEECTGWKELLKELSYRFHVEPETWWSKVAFPAFELNWTTVWGETLPGDAILLPRSPQGPGFPVMT